MRTMILFALLVAAGIASADSPPQDLLAQIYSEEGQELDSKRLISDSGVPVHLSIAFFPKSNLLVIVFVHWKDGAFRFTDDDILEIRKVEERKTVVLWTKRPPAAE